MTEDEFKALHVGDVVQHAGGGVTYVVTDNYGGRVTAVRTVNLTNPPEWNLVLKTHLNEPENHD